MVVKAKFSYFPFIIRMVDEDFSFTILPAELNEKPEYRGHVRDGTATAWSTRTTLLTRIKRFDGYWQGKPNIDRWHYPIIPEYANRYSQFVAKNVMSFTPNCARP